MIWVYVTGVAMLLAVVAINLRKHDQLAALLLSLMVLIMAFTVQLPGMTKEVAATDALGQTYKMMAMGGFFKDLGLAGGALLVAAAAKPKQA